MPALIEKHPGLKVLIAGGRPGSLEGETDPEQEKLKALAIELGVGEALEMLGQRSDVSAVLATLDVAVLCSDFEGSPLSVMEYMEAGLPIAATRVGGVPDQIEAGVTGLLIDPQDPAGLAEAVSSLLADPGRAATIGAAARERRRSEFSIEGTTRKIEALYEELYAAKRGSGA
jgi:glycosyltransferase involved in cell wall biosynthesis